MKHAGRDALDALEPLLVELRPLPGLTERRRGVFYRGAVAFLHFHEDPAGLFADLKEGNGFMRYQASGAADRKKVVAAARRALDAMTKPKGGRGR